MPPMQPPSYQDVLDARPRVYAAMPASPLMRHPLLDAWTGCETWVKHENHNPTGSFKVRGGLNLAGQLTADERGRGLIAASTGNHGQSVAVAAQRHGIRCRVVVPIGNNPEKNAAMRGYGAEVIEYGRDYDAAREHVERMAVEEGWRYVHTANEPALIAGVATCALEIFERLPEVEFVFVPIGGGSGAAAACLVRSAMGSAAKVIGVQAQAADAFARSWRTRSRISLDQVATFAEGIATRCTFDLTFSMLQDALDDLVTLDEEALRGGVRAALQCTHNLAEGAGAAALAAARTYPPARGRRVACVMTGGNADLRTLSAVLALPEAALMRHHTALGNPLQKE